MMHVFYKIKKSVLYIYISMPFPKSVVDVVLGICFSHLCTFRNWNLICSSLEVLSPFLNQVLGLDFDFSVVTLVASVSSFCSQTGFFPQDCPVLSSFNQLDQQKKKNVNKFCNKIQEIKIPLDSGGHTPAYLLSFFV